VLSGELKNKGYCIFTLNYGNRGLEPIQGSAQELDRFVDAVLDYTGANKVQVVGHSQAGMMPRYWIKFLGGASKLEDLVGIAPSNYGTRLSSASNEDSDPEDFNLPGDPTSEPCYACEQQGTGSKFLKRLNAGDDTPSMGSYTVIATNDDEIIPFRNCFLKGDTRTINLVVQRYNNGAPMTHQNIYQDPYAKALVFDALDNPGTADPERADFSPPPPTP
jgi:triacylglycerol esterase/lipase EstA (alpha/beta hydrolase family)